MAVPRSRRPDLPLAVALALLAGASLATPGLSRADDADSPAETGNAEEIESPCAAPEYRQLDFWVGSWDLTWEGGRGTNEVERLYGDCVIRETFEGGALRGSSVSTWDRKSGVWRQTWVDDHGSYLEFTGGPVGDRFVLARETTVDGAPVRQRMVFRDIETDSLTWDWESTRDDGETWNLLWRIAYRRRS